MEKNPKNSSQSFFNPDLLIEDRITLLSNQLTIPEKIEFLHSTAPAIPRLNIPEYHMGNEALHGVVRPGSATVFPQSVTFAATWDQDLIKKVGTAISDEARAKQNSIPNAHAIVFWCPTINMARHPQWGRTPETYGEDPWLAGRIAVSFIRGMQGDDPRYLKVAATPKHFAGNNQDSIRHKCRANIDMRSLREYYLPAFYAAIVEAKAQGVMGAYNALFGLPCCANPQLLTQILREEWQFPGFDGNGGFVVTDCAAINDFLWPRYFIAKTRKQAVAQAFNAGVDIECGSYVKSGNLLKAYKKGWVTQATIDRALRNVLRAQFLYGLYDPPTLNPYSQIPADVVGCEKHLTLAQKVAEKGIVLLKNSGTSSALLPLKVSEKKSIAVVGRNAAVAQIGDYSGIPTSLPTSPLDGIKHKYPESKITYVPWLAGVNSSQLVQIPPINVLPSIDCKKYRGFKRVTYDQPQFKGKATTTVDEHIDYFWGNKQIDQAISNAATDSDGGITSLEKFAIRWTGFLHVDVPGSYTLQLTYRPAKSNKNAKVTMKFGAQTTTGSGKLTLTPELQLDREYPIEIELPNGSQGDLIKFEWKLPSFKFDPAFTREVEAAKHSDVVIAILGLTPPEERENMDRNTMNLPADQLALLKALLAVNPNIIVVFIAGSPLNLDWLNDNIPAILIAWYPGQRGGEAIANIISGDVTPSGKLPFAYFRHDSDVISMDEYDITKGLTYWYNSKIPLYPFGFGLSYTTFKYANFSLSKTELTLDPLDTFFVHGEIFNMGSYDGEEIVQVYIRKVSDLNHIPLKRPYPKMQLKGFTKILVSKGSSMRVEIRVLLENLTFFDASTGQLKCESGIYDVMVGRSSQQIEFTQQIEIHP